MEIPGGKYAVGGWLPKSGRELRDAEELLTRIHVPVGD
jgi:DNA gyrase inhibitor GyrI